MTNRHNLPRSNRTSLAAAMAPHYRAAIDMVHRLRIRHVMGLHASTKVAIAQTASNLGSDLFPFLPSVLPPGKIHLAELITAQQKAADLLLNY